MAMDRAGAEWTPQAWELPLGRTLAATEESGLLQAAELAQERPTAAGRAEAALPGAGGRGSQRFVDLCQHGKQGQPQDRRRETGVEAEGVCTGVDGFGPSGQYIGCELPWVQRPTAHRLGGSPFSSVFHDGADGRPPASEGGNVQRKRFAAPQWDTAFAPHGGAFRGG